MSIGATCKWDVRTGGNNTNGGGYTSGGVDYSQQDAAHLTFTDLETKNGDYDRVYSAVNNASLVAGCIGNIIYISGGTGFIVGWYEVTGNGDGGGDGLYLDIDRDCNVGNENDGAAKLGGGLADLTVDAFLEQLVAGHKVYIETGTYTQNAADVNMAKDGLVNLPITFEGYKATHGDAPTGNDRPQFDMGAFKLIFDNYISFLHLRFTSSASAAWTLAVDSPIILDNLEVINTNGTSGHALQTAQYAEVTNCYLKALKGRGLNLGYGGSVIGSYIQALGAVYITYNNISITNSIFHGTGAAGGQGIIGHATRVGSVIVKGSTFYNFVKGIEGLTGHSSVIKGNIFHTCTTGIDWQTDTGRVYLDYNNFFNCGTDVTNVTKGSNATAIDPEFTDAPNGDFSIVSATLKGTGFKPYFNNTSDSYPDVGAVQTEDAIPVAPTFAGIVQLEAVGGGCLRATWAAATGTKTGYRIYVRVDSSDLFSATYLKAEIPTTDTEFIFRVDESNNTFLTSTGVYYVGIRAVNDGVEDSNTETLSTAIAGGGETYLNMNDIIAINAG